ncbi:type III-A CRISPR-associated protein Csm2 [Nitrosomonas sp. HPC101]|uniref:type III-A CRISPR-associated protein Csm2 n=1 Tax=Nitrosomonas sp. HPC101 TaxID=1658667 RepID=UPI001368443B|nr:type III-A CRISPR-associated protein Csm2 [Nitrosomonas sp. HPC101]MBE7527272.1 type III-A CRISPR-associated protein Csm2 [Burkholderiales bacterium]MXS85661.1 type III-A CRISPR-associated protein Csm2 [Nitrosomonas sp. HPC101]
MTPDLKTSPPPITLFSDDAEKIAQAFDDSAKADRKGREKNKYTQIRRFYDELVSWQERIGTDEQKFKDYEAFIHMLNAKAVYAQGRDLLTEDFVKWLRGCIAQIDSPRTLNHFRLHFEAMLGFLKGIRG